MAEEHGKRSEVGQAHGDRFHLLVRGVNWLGDAVMTTPALQRLRERFPRARISLLTHEKLVDLWRLHPSLDRVIAFAAGERPWSIGRRLRSEQFDAALIFPNSPRSAFEAWAARIPQRIGYGRPWRNWLLTRVVQDRPQHTRMRKLSANEVRRRIQIELSSGLVPARPFASADAHHAFDYLHLAAVLGANPSLLPPRLAVQPEEVCNAAATFNIEGSEHLLFGLNPGAEYGPAKRWPLQSFATAARILGRQLKCVFLILGGHSDIAAAAELESALSAASCRVFNVAGRTSLRELCALLKLCRVLITNDSGPMHIAAALGTPVVVPFGSTSPEMTAPGLPGDPTHRLLRSAAPCSPCFRRTCPIDLRCLNTISPDEVATAVLELAVGS